MAKKLGQTESWPFQMKENKSIRLLAYVTGLVNQELLPQNEYLAAENRILRTPSSSMALVRSGKIHPR
jgi:hypothetical protein